MSYLRSYWRMTVITSILFLFVLVGMSQQTLPHAAAQSGCINGASINVQSWHSNTTIQVTSNANNVTSVKLLNINGGSGYTAYVLKNWDYASPRGSQSLPTSGSVTIPIQATSGIIRIQIKHDGMGTQQGYNANVQLCSGQANPPTVTPTAIPTNTPIPTQSPTGEDWNCNPALGNATVSMGPLQSEAGWQNMMHNPNLGDVTGIQVDVVQGAAGHQLTLATNWGPEHVFETITVNNSGTFPILLPANLILASAKPPVGLSESGTQFMVNLTLCTGGGDSGGSGGGDCDQDIPFNSNDGVMTGQEYAAANGYTLSHGFGAWSKKLGVCGTLSDACINLHDSHWVRVDNKIYHTWHDVYEEHPTSMVNGQKEMCVYGHDHGDDPRTSPLFEYSGGMPAFGLAMETFNHGGGHMHGDLHRHEDHVGHKVTVATFRASIGNPPNSEEPVYDAGFYCHFLSKIHQGSYSNDAISNQLHEYFINVRCDDNPDGLKQRNNSSMSADQRLANPDNIRTEFSLKTMLPFGADDQFREMCDQDVVTAVSSNGQLLVTPLPNDPALEASRNPGLTVSASSLNHREVGCFRFDDPNTDDDVEGSNEYRYGSPETISQLDLWTQPREIKAPSGIFGTQPNVHFQVYYVIRDPIRIFDVEQNAVRYTVDYCHDVLAVEPSHRFCEGVTSGMEWDDQNSPFKGALRTIHFKKFAIYDNWHDEGSNARDEAFCTNALGDEPENTNSDGSCPAGMLLQKLNPFKGNGQWELGKNNWDSFENPNTNVVGTVSGSLYVLEQQVEYPFQPESNPTADYQLISGSALNGLIKPSNMSTWPIILADDSRPLNCPRFNLTNYPYPQHAYCPVGIGFEKIVDKRDVIPSYVCSRVAPDTASDTGRKNCTVHAPN